MLDQKFIKSIYQVPQKLSIIKLKVDRVVEREQGGNFMSEKESTNFEKREKSFLHGKAVNRYKLKKE